MAIDIGLRPSGPPVRFKNLKSNGFELEELQVQKEYKVQMMMAALVLAYTLAVVKGLKQFRRKIAIKKHDSPEITGPPVRRVPLWAGPLAESLAKLCTFPASSSGIL